jgi:subtilisin-like proprotein convertase family protein
LTQGAAALKYRGESDKVFRTKPTRVRFAAAALAAASLVADCGGGGGGVSGPVPTFTVSGTVSGTTTGLVLQLNGTESLPINADGPFAFTTLVAAGSTFGVMVTSQPSGESCVVDNGGGAMPTAAVTNVVVSCSALGSFSIAGLSDPLAPAQWHLKNTGQTAFADTPGISGFDINVDLAFVLGYAGAGVMVAVIDSGLEIAHEDLSLNVVPNGSWNFNTGTTNPTSTATTGDHGTSVAGLIAMVGNNGLGGIGVAPRARLKGFNLLAVPKPLESQFLDSIGASNASPNSSDVAIFNQSFGIDTITPVLVDPLDEAQYAAGTVGPNALRGGKGAIYVKAGGNGFQVAESGSTPPTTVDCTVLGLGLSCENANFDPVNTLPYQIIVGAVNASGIRASYSTAGSALWVSAPGGEFGQNNSVSGRTGVAVQPAMVTTDQSGTTQGFARTGATPPSSAFNQCGAPNTSCNYTNTFNGTSSATPVTVGVVALMLEANPALTWRDVKHILASTARKIDPSGGIVNVGGYSAEPGWLDNFASPTKFHYHNWYGFGLIDAGAAVNMAKTYSANLGTFTNTGFISSAGPGLAIPDQSAVGVTSTINVPAGTVQVIEAVQLRVNITHPFDGDLAIEVTSPTGMRSVVKNFADGYADAANLTNQVFLSNAFYGENPVGTWTIKVVDGFGGDVGTLNNWAIRVYGH